jgi:hypothetical protein
MILSINNKEQEVNNIEFFSALLGGIKHQYCELWLREDDQSPALGCFKSGDRCMLMYLRHPGDTGFTTRSGANIAEDKDEPQREFILANGQQDMYPESWTVPFSDGKRALEYFHFTKKKLADLVWHKD